MLKWLTIPLLFGLSFCARDESLAAYGAADQLWVLDAPQTLHLRFFAKGRVEGETACGPFSARQIHPYPWFGLTEITGCADPALSALQAMTLSEVSGRNLILSNEAGVEMAFRATIPAE